MKFPCYDLNVKYKGGREKERLLTIRRLYELGWDGVAWNTFILGRTNPSIKPSKDVDLKAYFDPQAKKTQVRRSLAVNSDAASQPLDLNTFRQLHRITLTIDDFNDVQNVHIGNTSLQEFDIVAVNPGNAKIFSYLCKSADVDIISLDFNHRLNFPINKKLLDEAIQRGVFFEISYSPLLSSSGARREMCSSTQIILQYLRGKQLILTSGVDNCAQLRGPMDVVNIASILGIAAHQAEAALSVNGGLVLKHALKRKQKLQPLEIISNDQFRARYPELWLKNMLPLASAVTKNTEKEPQNENTEYQDEEEEELKNDDEAEEEVDEDKFEDEKEEFVPLQEHEDEVVTEGTTNKDEDQIDEDEVIQENNDPDDFMSFNGSSPSIANPSFPYKETIIKEKKTLVQKIRLPQKKAFVAASSSVRKFATKNKLKYSANKK